MSLSKASLSVCLLMFITPLAYADKTTLAIQACRAVTDSLERLNCYDAIPLKDKLKQKQPMPAQMTHSVKDKAATHQPVSPSAPKKQFGLQSKPDQKALENVSDTVIKLSKSARGKRLIHMKSGAVWQQTDSNFLKLKTGMDIYIERGTLGAFFLSHQGISRRIKVKRIQ